MTCLRTSPNGKSRPPFSGVSRDERGLHHADNQWPILALSSRTCRTAGSIPIEEGRRDECLADHRRALGPVRNRIELAPFQVGEGNHVQERDKLRSLSIVRHGVTSTVRGSRCIRTGYSSKSEPLPRMFSRHVNAWPRPNGFLSPQKPSRTGKRPIARSSSISAPRWWSPARTITSESR